MRVEVDDSSIYQNMKMFLRRPIIMANTYGGDRSIQFVW